MINRGVGILWAVAGVTLSLTGSLKIQDMDYTSKAEMEAIKDANGETVSKIYYDPTQDCSFTCIPTGTSGSVTISDNAIGSLFTVTDASTPVGGTTWIVEEFGIKRSNTNAARWTLKAFRSPNISS